MQRMRQDCVGTRIICMNVLVLQAAPEEVDCMSTSPPRILGRRFGQSILLAAQQPLQHGVLRPEPGGSRVEAVPKREGSLAALIEWLMVVGLTLQLC